MHTWSSTFQDSSTIHRGPWPLAGYPDVLSQITCALPLLPSTLFGHTAMPHKSRLGLSPCIPSFYSQWCQTLPGSTAPVWKTDPPQSITHWSWHLTKSLRNQFLQRLACSSQPNQISPGGKKNISHHLQLRKKKSVLRTWTQRKYKPVLQVSGESSKVISTQTASLKRPFSPQLKGSIIPFKGLSQIKEQTILNPSYLPTQNEKILAVWNSDFALNLLPSLLIH